MAFLPWCQPAFDHLRHLREQNRFGHAWLIGGPPGVGKLHFVQELARWLFCSTPTAQGACGECQDCHLFDVGSHPDWLLLQPEKKQITVGQVRELIEFAQGTSQRGMQVLVIAPAEAMNLNAANAVLKILEEPPPNTVLLLVSHQTTQLLATLRSRCQQLPIPLPSTAQALAWLQHQGISGVERLLTKAKGAPLKALSLASDDVLVAQDMVLAQLVALMGSTTKPIQAAKMCEKFSVQTSIEFMLSLCQELLRALQTGAAPTSEVEPLLDQLRARGAQHALISLLHDYQVQVQAAYKVALAPNNANALLMLEALFGSWVKMRERVRRSHQ